MSYLFEIEPKWNIDDYKRLDYKLDKHKGDEDNHRYIEAGHLPQSLSLYNYFEPNPMPESIEYIKNKFDKLHNISVAVNLFKPGQYMPIHYDRFDTYKKINNLPSNSSICRYMIMLEDSQPGQMLQVEEFVYNKWKAGYVYGWCNHALHTFYNLSTHNRYAVQITGQVL
jgi:hypothetical protein